MPVFQRQRKNRKTLFEAQVSYYTQKIQANPEWAFVEVYSDEGITGTNTKSVTASTE